MICVLRKFVYTVKFLNENMVYLITGASSFIGRQLVSILCNEGHNVIAVLRPGSSQFSLFPQEVKIIELDLSNYKSLYQQIKQVDIIIHLAWKGTSKEERDNASIQHENVLYTYDLLESAQKMNCRLFVFSGSQAEYGCVKNIIFEDTVCTPLTEYGKAKLAVKEIGVDFSSGTYMDYVHLRIFSLYGEGDHPSTLIMNSLRRMLRNEEIRLTSCAQSWNYLYVKDAAWQIQQICHFALKGALGGSNILNIASKDTRPLRDFVEVMKVLTKTRSLLMYGAIQQENVPSLNPDISRLEKIVGEIRATPFEKVIQGVISLMKIENI